MLYGSVQNSLKSMERFLWFSIVGLDLTQKEFLFTVQCLFKKQMILKAQQYSVVNK